MRPLPILASAADLGINLQSVAEAANAAPAEPHTFQFTGTETLARANHPAVNALASELLPTVRSATGDRFLEPASTHVLQYRNGDQLHPHRNGGNLDVTLSVLLRLDGLDRWPVHFEQGRGQPPTSHPQAEGDALIIDGKLRTRWREPLTGAEAIVVMCHYQRPGGMVFLEPDIPEIERRAFMEWVNKHVTGSRWYEGKVLGASGEQLDVWATRRAILKKRNGDWEALICHRMDEVLAFGNPNLEPVDYVQYTTYTPEMGAEGGHFAWHVDSRGRQPDQPPFIAKRVLSGSLVLEGPEEGGALEVEHAPVAPQITGSAILFPSVNTSHRVTPVKRGRRVSLVAWAYEWGDTSDTNPFITD